MACPLFAWTNMHYWLLSLQTMSRIWLVRMMTWYLILFRTMSSCWTHPRVIFEGFLSGTCKSSSTSWTILTYPLILYVLRWLRGRWLTNNFSLITLWLMCYYHLTLNISPFFWCISIFLRFFQIQYLYLVLVIRARTIFLDHFFQIKKLNIR